MRMFKDGEKISKSFWPWDVPLKSDVRTLRRMSFCLFVGLIFYILFR